MTRAIGVATRMRVSLAPAQSGLEAGMGEGRAGMRGQVVVFPILWKFFGGLYEDMRRMEQILAASDTDWTVFRPPRLTNGPLTGHARTAIGKPLPGGRVVSRADLAAAVLAAIDDRATVRQAVAIAR
jgi:NAD(P)H-binding